MRLCKIEKETGSDRWPDKQAYLVAASLISALSKRAREKRLPTFPDEVDFLRRWIGSVKPRAAKQSSRVFGQRIATSSTNDPSRSWFLRSTSDMDISCPDYSVYSLKISWPRKWSDSIKPIDRPIFLLWIWSVFDVDIWNVSRN